MREIVCYYFCSLWHFSLELSGSNQVTANCMISSFDFYILLCLKFLFLTFNYSLLNMIDIYSWVLSIQCSNTCVHFPLPVSTANLQTLSFPHNRYIFKFHYYNLNSMHLGSMVSQNTHTYRQIKIMPLYCCCPKTIPYTITFF